jgi:hypothetical protein
MKMTYEGWMADTAAFGRIRSTHLKALDGALKAYELAVKNSTGSVLKEKTALQQALAAWKASEGDWRNSVRNKLKAIERLDAEVGLVIVGAGGLNSRGEVMDAADVRARKAVADAIKQNTKTMFLGQKLTVKPSKVLADANEVRSALSGFKSTATQVKSAVGGAIQPNLTQQVQGTLVSLFGNATAAEVQAALGPVFSDFLTNVTPFVGTIKSGGQAIVKWGQAAKSLYDKHQMKAVSSSFAPGDPAAAFDAILAIQKREAEMYATSASIHTASAAAKGAFAATDFGAISGPTLGAAESLAVLVQKIYLFARDWNEMGDANKLMASGVADLSLFKTCPLLGCYLIGNSDTSAIINMAVGDYGKAGWTFEVEAMVKKAKPVFDKARSAILDSRYEILGLQGMKGTVVNRKDKTLGLPTGKIQGLKHDVEGKFDRLIRRASDMLDGDSPGLPGVPEEEGPVQL